MSNGREKSITEYFRDIESARMIFRNVHSMAKGKRSYHNVPLWVLMQDMAGHGSGYSADFVKELGYNPDQPIQAKLD